MRLHTKAACTNPGALLLFLAVVLHSGCTSMLRMPGKSFRGAWVLLGETERAIEHDLRRHVQKLSGEIGEHNVFTPKAYAAAADYVASELALAGRPVRRHAYRADGHDCYNLEIEFPGSTRSNELVIVGAHYDTVRGCAGANDNSSGVAALMVLARAFSNAAPQRTLRLVAFANEEPPFFQTELMGSLVYARECRRRGENIIAMLSLETIGYYSDERGSQHYPFPLGAFYPSRGNFMGFVGNTSSKKLVHECLAVFREGVQFPSEGAALPSGLPGVGWSDHWSFWQAGYPAIMVTDTAPFRYEHYHQTTDTPDKLVYDRMARVVGGIELVVRKLAEASAH